MSVTRFHLETQCGDGSVVKWKVHYTGAAPEQDNTDDEENDDECDDDDEEVTLSDFSSDSDSDFEEEVSDIPTTDEVPRLVTCLVADLTLR